MTVKVLFVCLGNICRSPSAQGIMEKLAADRGLGGQIQVDSCGTAAFNVGKAPDPRAIAAASRAGYSIEQQIARQIDDIDYQEFDYIIAMDRQNLINVEAWATPNSNSEIKLLLDYLPGGTGSSQIPDPYYQEAESFDAVVATLEKATVALFAHILSNHQLETNQ
jgi:protein-tyrosine phosphatase